LSPKAAALSGCFGSIVLKKALIATVATQGAQGAVSADAA
jgi:hypothetical protein